jgi:hypothetical protein
MWRQIDAVLRRQRYQGMFVVTKPRVTASWVLVRQQVARRRG